MISGNKTKTVTNNNTMVKSKSTPNIKKFQLEEDEETVQKKQGRAARFHKNFKKSSSFNTFNDIPKGDSVSNC